MLAEPLEAAFEQLGAADKVVLVFAEKAFVNSAGLAVLFDLIETAQEADKRVRVVESSMKLNWCPALKNGLQVLSLAREKRRHNSASGICSAA